VLNPNKNAVNLLVPPIANRSRLRKRKAPVTIIIGIKCFDGIVIACDSRTTNETGHINDNAEKLHVVRFKDGNTAIVGEAGNAIMSSIAIEQMQLLAKDRNLEEYRAVAQCAEDAIAHVIKDSICGHRRRASEAF
jgi:20S proteasome alpha/beta subunit